MDFFFRVLTYEDFEECLAAEPLLTKPFVLFRTSGIGKDFSFPYPAGNDQANTLRPSLIRKLHIYKILIALKIRTENCTWSAVV